jgi:small-conductance mechanosensitive channel
LRIRGHVYRVDWGHLLFVALIAAAVLWYLLDARSVSLRVNNLLLVQPVALFALLMVVLIIPQCFQRADREIAGDEQAEDDPLAPALPKEARALIQIGIVAVALGALVFTLNVIGFDIAIWLFCLVVMLVCNERRPLPLILYPIAVTLVLVYGFRALMPYPMVTTVL